jgi:alkanesulfonate monooxygenase
VLAVASAGVGRSERPDPSFSWFVPVDGDGEHLGTLRAERPPTLEMLREVVLTAEAHGYRSLLVPTRFANGLFDQQAPLAETWTTAAALVTAATRIRLLIAVRPGFISTPLFAQMAATLDHLSDHRIDLNVVPGGIQGEFERFGVDLPHDDRYRLAEEFIDACRQLWDAGGGPVSYAGESVRFDDVHTSPAPPSGAIGWYLGGASDAALGLAARRGDVLLAWIQPRPATVALLERARAAFAAAGRAPSFGLRTHIVLGDTETDAWDAAAELLRLADDSVRAQRDRSVAGTAMVGAAAQAVAVADHRLGERLWNGISTVRVNCGTAIVGTPEQVAEELAAYWDLGFDEMVLSSWPHAEGAARVADQVLPLVRERIGARR